MQLVSMARALVHSPALLLADEPTGNVNHKVGRAIMEILRRTAKEQGTGIAMVTHSPEHAAWADRVCFLKDGVIVREHLQHGNKDGVSVIYEHLVELGI
jgi:putative ABC transport system ATP-binding protein